MRTIPVALFCLILMSFIACRDSSTAHQAGKEAYRASRELKQGAKRAVKDIRSAGKEFRQGWSEEKRKEKASPKEK